MTLLNAIYTSISMSTGTLEATGVACPDLTRLLDLALVPPADPHSAVLADLHQHQSTESGNHE
jgi:hypothetical protein